jgi:hypothetical protein
VVGYYHVLILADDIDKFILPDMASADDQDSRTHCLFLERHTHALHGALSVHRVWCCGVPLFRLCVCGWICVPALLLIPLRRARMWAVRGIKTTAGMGKRSRTCNQSGHVDFYSFYIMRPHFQKGDPNSHRGWVATTMAAGRSLSGRSMQTGQSRARDLKGLRRFAKAPNDTSNKKWTKNNT